VTGGAAADKSASFQNKLVFDLKDCFAKKSKLVYIQVD